MFTIKMGTDFKIGETRACKINGAPAHLTWRDKHTLVIEPGDARQIVYMDRDKNGILFACANADDAAPPIPPIIMYR